MTAVETHELAVGRGGRPVLEGVTLAVAPGERLALVGPNGCGKTTLLRALAGLDRPLAGAIHWQGGPLPSGPARVRQVGVLLQGEDAAPFSVGALVALGLGLDGPPGPQHLTSVAAALDRVSLDGLTDRSCQRLSGGEWQRAALARALVADPGLLLLDEPTSHLDPARRAALLALLDGLRGRVAVVLATHDLDCAATADRVALLAGGRLAVLGPPAAVLTADHLAGCFGVRVRRLDDPRGGPPFLRVEGLA